MINTLCCVKQGREYVGLEKLYLLLKLQVQLPDGIVLGWLARHLKSSHGLAVPNDPITPPSAVIADVGLPIGETVSAVILAGQTPSVVSLNIPMSSSRDGGSGRIGVRQSRPTVGQGGCI
jgi:hypothetical protein